MGNTQRSRSLDGAADDALEMLVADTRTHRARIVMCACFSVAAVVSFLVATSGLLGSDRARLGGLAVSLGFALLAGLSAPRDLGRAVAALAEIEDPAAVGSLLAAMEPATQADRAALVAALSRLLPLVAAEDADAFTRRKWQTLYHVLLRCDLERETDLMIALLTTLGRAGGEDAVAHVERLAVGPEGTAQERRVRRAAQTCLTELRARVDRAAPGRLLMRPATAPGGDPHHLLRPVTDAPRGDPRHLLRPTGKDDAHDSREA